ncbi:hypothetical protein M199_gp112 [Halogranum tailed virus 1]|uniref:Uncharacterized protein n=1 Tax=Halogranum tailed virus 1 TaxID=1273749 RepID=R4T744_9CAUD|nr:hypothetical protein M199_gp112 [Halogranum tailed virus 1]AGM11554.1 hypothetical protein HGTV1_257 [Halogranum tailed virus 1]
MELAKTIVGLAVLVVALALYAISGAVSFGVGAAVIAAAIYFLGIVGIGTAKAVFLAILAVGAVLGVIIGILQAVILTN